MVTGLVMRSRGKMRWYESNTAWRSACAVGESTMKRESAERSTSARTRNPPRTFMEPSEVYLQPVVCRRDLERLVAARELLEAPRLLEQPLERRVVVRGLVVEEH